MMKAVPKQEMKQITNFLFQNLGVISLGGASFLKLNSSEIWRKIIKNFRILQKHKSLESHCKKPQIIGI